MERQFDKSSKSQDLGLGFPRHFRCQSLRDFLQNSKKEHIRTKLCCAMAREVKSDVVPLQQVLGWFRLNLLHAWQRPVEALFVFCLIVTS